MAGSSPKFIECSFLIPIRGDAALSDGSSHSTEQWDWLTGELWSRSGQSSVGKRFNYCVMWPEENASVRGPRSSG